VSADDLRSHAFVRGAGLNFQHRGERLTRFSLRRMRVAVCPERLKHDIANTNSQPQLAPYGRALWQIDAIKTCPTRDLALVTIAEDMTPGQMHDFTHHAAPALAGLDHLIGQAERRRPTGLEIYVLTRLGGERRSPYLDSLDLFVAIKTCELLGAVDLFGRTANLNRLTDEE
jgi:hypothetical protein